MCEHPLFSLSAYQGAFCYTFQVSVMLHLCWDWS